MDGIHLPDFIRLPFQAETGQGVTASWYAELDFSPVVRHFRDQVTNPVHRMNARQNPLFCIIASDPQATGLVAGISKIGAWQSTSEGV